MKVYQNVVANYMLRIFNLKIIPEYVSYTSSADNCKLQQFGVINSDNTTLDCECLHDDNHLTSEALLNDLNDGTPNTTVVIWTGHLLGEGERSNSRKFEHTVIMIPTILSINDPTKINDIVDEYIYDTVHELSHQLGAPDHYCYNGYDKEDASAESEDKPPCINSSCDYCVNNYRDPYRDCVMQKYPVETLTGENVHCDDCESTILKHLISHH